MRVPLKFNSETSQKHLRFLTLNCLGYNSSRTYLRTLCDNHDILFLQETWLTRDELHTLKLLHPDFDGEGVTAIDTESTIRTGRPFGGVAILWRKHLSPKCTVIDYKDPRIMGLELLTDSGKTLFINVYLPYQCYDNTENYMYYLGKIQAIIDEVDTSNIVVLGDFNAAVGTNFENELQIMCERLNLTISDYVTFGRESGCYTYVSHSTDTTSWLDHVICSHSMSKLICKMSIHNKSPVSDHLVLSANVKDHCISNISNPVPSKNTTPTVKRPTVNWAKATPKDISSYCHCTKEKLMNIILPVSTLSCNNVECTDASHLAEIDKLYKDVCDSILTSGQQTLRNISCKNANNYVVPGWNDYVDEAHDEARHHYIIWRNSSLCGYHCACAGPALRVLQQTKYSHRNFRFVAKCKQWL